MSTAHRKILVYLVLTFAFSSPFYYWMIAAGAIGGYTFPLMWCPGVAAILTQLLFQRNLRGMGWGIGKAKYLLVGYGLPFLAASLWPAVLLHASHNMFVQLIFTPLTSDTGYTEYVIDEFGIGLAIALALLGYLFWRKRGELNGSFATVPSARAN